MSIREIGRPIKIVNTHGEEIDFPKIRLGDDEDSLKVSLDNSALLEMILGTLLRIEQHLKAGSDEEFNEDDIE